MAIVDGMGKGNAQLAMTMIITKYFTARERDIFNVKYIPSALL